MTTNPHDAPTEVRNALTQAKLDAFAQIEADFIASFSFVQDVHGQRRFDTFPLAQTVHYLQALYTCECKDMLLSIPVSASRYEGARCLELLRDWQNGKSAGVVAFIHRKLDDQPYGELTAQIEEALRVGDAPLVQRLISGRAVLLNRNITLSYALDAIFALDPAQTGAEVSALCAEVGLTPAEIERRLADLHTLLYSFAPNGALARRNMLLMNHLGQRIMSATGDHPGERTARVLSPTSPEPSYAEEAIAGQTTLVSLHWSGPIALPTPTTPPPATAEGIPGAVYGI